MASCLCGCEGKGEEVNNAFQITANHFCAGGELINDKAVNVAPIIKYMNGWNESHMRLYCDEKKWNLHIINEFKVGNYTLEKYPKESNFPNGTYSITRDDGEGMSVRAEEFEKMIEEWYQKTF